MICKLCGTQAASKYCENKVREFWRCDKCGLISVPQKYYISAYDELERYNLHDNTSANTGYVTYLDKCASIVKRIMPEGKRILDFGSGKDAVLAGILCKNGYACDAYDPLYSRGLASDAEPYDCIIICEVIEHLKNLSDELELIRKMAARETKIIIRTQLYPPYDQFLKWWYIQDLTHINFFTYKTIETAAQILCCTAEKTEHNDIFLLHNDTIIK